MPSAVGSDCCLVQVDHSADRISRDGVSRVAQVQLDVVLVGRRAGREPAPQFVGRSGEPVPVKLLPQLARREREQGVE